MVTACLRSEQCDSEAEFLCQMFQHIPQDLQHRLLVMTADHSEDTMEHCKLLLLLLRRFPQTIATHGVHILKYDIRIWLLSLEDIYSYCYFSHV